MSGADLSHFDKLTDEVAAIARAVYALADGIAGPGVTRRTLWGFPGFARHKHVLCVAGQKAHVNLQLFRGSQLPNPHELIEGTGGLMRHIKFRDLADVDRPGVREAIEAAFAYDLELGP